MTNIATDSAKKITTTLTLLAALFSRKLVAGIPFFWLFFFLFLPFIIILKISVSESVLSIPPYKELISWSDFGVMNIHLNISRFYTLFVDPIYQYAYWNSLKLSFISTIGCLVIGYPLAYFIAQFDGLKRTFFLTLIILPFWTSFLIRIYAWMGRLSLNGFINKGLIALGLIETPFHLMNTDLAVCIGIIYCYLPFMVLPIYAILEKQNERLIEAAQDLGARPFKTFRKITFPLSLPGVITGSMLVFIPALGEFVIPELLGGAETIVIGKIVWSEFFNNRDWPMAASVAIVLLVVILIPVMLLQNLTFTDKENDS